MSGLGGSIGVTSDYVYRGVSLSAGNPAIQADLHYRTSGGWVVGTWASYADMGADDGPGSELDLYISRGWILSPDWDLRTTLTHYTYPDDPRRASYDYDELVASLGYQSRLFATVAWSPNATRYSHSGWVEDSTALSYELTAVQPLIGQLAASAGVGYYDLARELESDYWYWNVGLACSLGHAQFAVSYIDTDQNASRALGYENTGGRWAGSVTWRF